MTKTAVFAGGCFWCTEAVFEDLKGVLAVMPGYTGGTKPRPTYEEVCAGATGHAEAIKIDYDPAAISYHDLLTVFFASHDPTQLNRQGNDVGTQYRSAVFYADESQKKEAEDFIRELNAEGPQAVTAVEPLGEFYPAEDYHRQFYLKNTGAPYCELVINPKLQKLHAEYSRLLKDSAK